MKLTTLFGAALAAAVTFSAVQSDAQIRHDQLYIDKGNGTYTILQSAGAGTYTFPTGSGNIITDQNLSSITALTGLTGAIQYPTGIDLANNGATFRLFDIQQAATAAAGDALQIVAGAAGATSGLGGGDLILASGAKNGGGADGDVILKTGGASGTTQLTANHTNGVTVNNGNFVVTSGSITGSPVYGGSAATSTLTLQSTSATGTTDAINMKVGNNGATQALNITHAGVVGIGSAQQLTVDQSGNLSTSGTATVPTVYGGSAATSTLTLQSTSGTGTTDAINMKVGNNGATQALNITDAGVVGIGSAQQLTVDQSGNLSTSGTATVPSVIGGTGATSTLTLQSTSIGAASTTDAINMKVGNNGATQALNITHAGVVGIGSAQQLTVDQSGNLSTTGTMTSDDIVSKHSSSASVAPMLVLYNTGAAAANTGAAIHFDAENNGASEIIYESIEGSTVSTGTGAENGQLALKTINGGTLTTRATFDVNGVTANGSFITGSNNTAGHVKIGNGAASNFFADIKTAAGGLSADRTYTIPTSPDANVSFPLVTSAGTALFTGPTAAHTYTLPDADVTLLSSATDLIYGATATSNNSLADGTKFLFNVKYGSTTVSQVGASIAADATVGNTIPSVSSTALTVLAKADATDAGGESATGLSISAVGTNGATATAINVTGGNVAVAGNISTSGSGTITSNGLLTASSGFTETSGATILSSVHNNDLTTVIPDNVTVYTVDNGGGAGPTTLTMPAGSDGKILYVYNNDAADNITVNGVTLNNTAGVSPHAAQFVYFHTAGWKTVSTF